MRMKFSTILSASRSTRQLLCTKTVLPPPWYCPFIRCRQKRLYISFHGKERLIITEDRLRLDNYHHSVITEQFIPLFTYNEDPALHPGYLSTDPRWYSPIYKTHPSTETTMPAFRYKVLQNNHCFLQSPAPLRSFPKNNKLVKHLLTCGHRSNFNRCFTWLPLADSNCRHCG